LAPAKPGQSAEPKPTAGRQGTQITVEDLFYNIPTRKKAFRSSSEEYNKILDMVGRYAVHCQGVAFSCKKHGESSTSLSISQHATSIDRIRQIHGSSVSNELIEFSCDDKRFGFKAIGWTTSANYHVKKTTILLFINHRCVESTNIRKAVEQTYSAFLPKGGHPFTYLNLEIEPARVDVNVHPTKREVNFLNEDEIIEVICNEIRAKLAAVDTSRTFLTQSLLPGARVPIATASGDALPPPLTPASRSTQKPYENNLVRTDAKLRKITTMLQPSSPQVASAPDRNTQTRSGMGDDFSYEQSDREPVTCRLKTIKELRNTVREEMHNELTETFARHTFVGIVVERRRLAAIQSGVKLLLVDYGLVSSEYFYQVGLTDFGNFGTIKFDPAPKLRDLLRIAAEHEKSRLESPQADSFDVDEVTEAVSTQLIQRKDMLLEYFSMEISDTGNLISIPLLMKGYTPSLAKLPRFLLRLGPHVNWRAEKECFETFLRELADFYVPEQLPSSDIDAETTVRRAAVKKAVEERLFPAFASRLIGTKRLMAGAVLEVANLKGLYRVFERC